jgi:hypothetical protein
MPRGSRSATSAGDLSGRGAVCLGPAGRQTAPLPEREKTGRRRRRLQGGVKVERERSDRTLTRACEANRWGLGTPEAAEGPLVGAGRGQRARRGVEMSSKLAMFGSANSRTANRPACCFVIRRERRSCSRFDGHWLPLGGWAFVPEMHANSAHRRARA